MKHEPFPVRPQTGLFFASPTHQQALDLLNASIQYEEPLILVHGDYGTGKTLTCLKLLESYEDGSCNYIFFPSSDVTWLEVLRKVASFIGISQSANMDKDELKEAIYHFYSYCLEITPLYLIFDDFHDTKDSIILHLKNFVNFHIKGQFPIRLILIAHTSFIRNLENSGDMEPFLQRLRRRIKLDPLTDEEIREYIYFRLFNAGAKGRPVFSDNALAEIKKVSRGIPRLINNICDAALIVAARKNSDQINKAIINEASALYRYEEEPYTPSEVKEHLSYESAFQNLNENATSISESENSFLQPTTNEPEQEVRKNKTVNNNELESRKKERVASSGIYILLVMALIGLTVAVTYIIMEKQSTTPEAVSLETAKDKGQVMSNSQGVPYMPSTSNNHSGPKQPIKKPQDTMPASFNNKKSETENHTFRYDDIETDIVKNPLKDKPFIPELKEGGHDANS